MAEFASFIRQGERSDPFDRPAGENCISERFTIPYDRIGPCGVQIDRRCEFVSNVAVVVAPYLLEADDVGVNGPDRLDDRREALFEWPKPPPEVPCHHAHRHAFILAELSRFSSSIDATERNG
jgi:hypothetical protein